MSNFPSAIVIQQAKLAADAKCMVCGNYNETKELVYTGDDQSCEGWEGWSWCKNCQIDTFTRIPKI